MEGRRLGLFDDCYVRMACLPSGGGRGPKRHVFTNSRHTRSYQWRVTGIENRISGKVSKTNVYLADCLHNTESGRITKGMLDGEVEKRRISIEDK